jgi:Zn finger protein HypA/HybF involved in hydrogenase expression
VNDNFPRLLRLNNSGFGCFLTLILISLLLGAVGLGWVVNSFLILFAFLLLSPVLAWFGFRWWLKRNLVEAQCPVCNYEFTGFNGTECRCPSCGEPLKVESGRFQRLTPPGTIDVEAIEVSVQRLDEQ